MRSANYKYESGNWLPQNINNTEFASQAQLVLTFGARNLIGDAAIYQSLRNEFPSADIALCCTAGEILDEKALTNSIVATCLFFDSTQVKSAVVNINDYADSYTMMTDLLSKLPPKDLVYSMILSDGGLVNGAQMMLAAKEKLGERVFLTGGMAGDGVEFKTTYCGLNSAPVAGNVVAIGLYGKNLRVTHGLGGGWNEFGSEHIITKSEYNKVFEINGENAITVYKRQFGTYMKHLPASLFMYPLAFFSPDADEPLIRSFLLFDEKAGAITFAGDLPVGARVKFAKGSFSALIDAARTASLNALENAPRTPDYVFLVISVGRKFVLGPGADEELQVIRPLVDKTTVMSGFYSYGEFSPFNGQRESRLHNQTIVITCFYEN